MPRINGTNDTQSKFLRVFLTNPAGPPADAWPSPVVLRRWLKKPSFRAALAQIREAYRSQVEMHLASAAARCALNVAQNQIENQNSKIENNLELLRLYHLRQRFPIPDPPPPPPPPSLNEDILAALRQCHPDATIATFLDFHKDHLPPEDKGESCPTPAQVLRE